MNKSEILLSPIKIGTRTSQNRFFIQPMECNDADADGNPTDLTFHRYDNLFKGEAGLVSLEAITITDKNRSRMNQLFIMPKNEKALANFVRRLREVNPKTLFIFQLTHSGELSNPEFSKRLSVKPLPGYEADVFTED
jgi:2,4-dienoyl-CoA reductase-like NADH-dependent reductase (Old Yellow Enzyme family)